MMGGKTPSLPEDFLLNERFLDYCRNDPSASAYWDCWLREHESKRAAFDEAVILYHLLYGSAGVSAFANASGEFEQILNQRESRKRRRTRYLYIAAAFMVCCLCIGLLFYKNLDGEDILTNAIVLNSIPEKGRMLENRSVGRQHFILPDKSHLILNGHTSLFIDGYYNSRSRHLNLITGMVFFDVQPNKMLPFKVQAGDTEIHVLGTSFLLSRDDEIEETAVFVLTGKVGVQSGVTDGNKETILKAGERVFRNQKLQTISMEAFTTESIENWKNNILIFDEKPLQEVFEEIGKWYGVRVHMLGQVPESATYSASFQEKDLKTVLAVLSYTYPFRYKLSAENELIINF